MRLDRRRHRARGRGRLVRLVVVVVAAIVTVAGLAWAVRTWSDAGGSGVIDRSPVRS